MTRPKPNKSPKVAGEQVELLAEALRQIAFETDPDGMVHLWMDLPPGGDRAQRDHCPMLRSHRRRVLRSSGFECSDSTVIATHKLRLDDHTTR